MESLRDGKELKIRPLADVTPLWERDLSVYPDALKVAMTDGQVVTYRLEIEMPKPCLPSFDSAVDTIRKWNEEDMVVGYQARHAAIEKKKSRWERFLAARGNHR